MIVVAAVRTLDVHVAHARVMGCVFYGLVKCICDNTSYRIDSVLGVFGFYVRTPQKQTFFPAAPCRLFCSSSLGLGASTSRASQTPFLGPSHAASADL